MHENTRLVQESILHHAGHIHASCSAVIDKDACRYLCATQLLNVIHIRAYDIQRACKLVCKESTIVCSGLSKHNCAAAKPTVHAKLSQLNATLSTRRLVQAIL